MRHYDTTDYATARGIASALADELGLGVQIDETCTTPCADVAARTITLPPPRKGREQAWHGVLDHEAAHLVWTEPAPGARKPSLHACLNALEDCRINQRMAARYPGSGANIRAAIDCAIADMHASGRKHTDPLPVACLGAMGAIQPGMQRTEPPIADEARDLYERAKAWGAAHASQVLDAKHHADLLPLAEALRALWPDDPDEQPQQYDAQGQPENGGGEGDEEGKGKGKGKGGGGHGASLTDASPMDAAAQSAAARNHGDAAPLPDITARITTTPPRADSTVARKRFEHSASQALAAMGGRLAAEVRSALQASTLRGRQRRQAVGRRLDGGSLPAILAHDPEPRPWQRRNAPKPDPSTELVLIVDGSGSMRDRDRWAIACGAAAAIAQACAVLPGVTLRIVTNCEIGYRPVAIELFTLLSPGQRFVPAMRLDWCRVEPCAGTEGWAPAVEWAEQQTRRTRRARRVCLLITDGGLTGSDPIELPKAARCARKAGMEVYGVAWGPAAAWGGALPSEHCYQSKALVPDRHWLRIAMDLIRQGAPQ